MHIRNGIVLVDVTGFTRNQYIRKAGPPVESITDPDKLIGWWDFTNPVDSELNQAVDGTGAAADADGDLIGYVKNLSNSTNKLGNFLRSRTVGTATAPAFRTGGCNGHSYADFEGALAGRLFATAGTDGTDGLAYGGVGAASLSSATLNSANMTMFFVITPKDLAVVGGDDVMFMMHKTYDGGSNHVTDKFQLDATTDDVEFVWRYNSAASVNMASGVPGTEDPQIWTIQAGSGTNGLKFYQNGDQSVGTSSTLSANDDYTLASLNSRIAIGGAILDNDGSSGSASYKFHCYEIIIYDELLSDTEITNVNNYLLNKYACINEEPVNPTISNHVGWWDFTDAATVFSDVGATSNMVGEVGGYVGHVLNKAVGDSGNKLGRFARTATDVDADKPKWGTAGGANGQPYLECTGPTTGIEGRGLLAGYFTGENADTYGGSSPTLFDNLILESQNTTVIIVAKNDNATITADEYAFGLNGHSATSSTTNSIFRYRKDETTQDGTTEWIDIGNPTETLETTAALDTNTNIMMFVGDTTAKLYRNGILEDTEVFNNNETMDFDGSNTAQGFPAVCIGSRPTVVGKGSAGSEWNGLIYEIHVYNKTLSTAELNEMLDYLGPKYGIATTVIT